MPDDYEASLNGSTVEKINCSKLGEYNFKSVRNDGVSFSESEKHFLVSIILATSLIVSFYLFLRKGGSKAVVEDLLKFSVAPSLFLFLVIAAPFGELPIFLYDFFFFSVFGIFAFLTVYPLYRLWNDLMNSGKSVKYKFSVYGLYFLSYLAALSFTLLIYRLFFAVRLATVGH